MKIAAVLIFIITMILGGGSGMAHAGEAPPAAVPGADGTLVLSSYLESFFDPDATLTLDDVAVERGGGVEFRPPTASPPTFGLTTGAAWGRVRLDLSGTQAADRWLLAIQTLLISRADIFLVAEDGRVLATETRGMKVAPVPAGRFQYTVDLIPYSGKAVTLYLRVQSRFVLVLSPVLRTQLAHARHEAEMGLVKGSVLSASIGVTVLFAAFWALLQNRLYGYASGVAFGVTTTELVGSGFNRALGLSWANDADWWIMQPAAILALYCLPMFVALYLDLPRCRPRLFRLIRLGAIGLATLNTGLLLLRPHLLLNGTTLSFVAVSLLTLWLIFFQRGIERRSRWSLLLSMGPFLILTTLHLVAFNRWAPDLLPWRGWVPQLFTIGQTALLAGFALALADLFRFRLESLVEERTAQLSAATAQAEDALIAEQAARQRLRHFIQMASHEFKTPLAVIDGAAQVLPLLVNPLSDGAQRRLDNIQASVRRLLGIIEACLADDRLDEEGMVLRITPFDPAALIREVVQYQRLVHAHPIRVRADTLPPVIHGDSELLQIVLKVLLDNAAKYSAADTAIEIEGRFTDGAFAIQVMDRGIGVPEDEQGQLFARYFRASNVSAVPGTGLGLYLAKSIMERHRGKLAVCSRNGGGTVFSMILPTA